MGQTSALRMSSSSHLNPLNSKHYIHHKNLHLLTSPQHRPNRQTQPRLQKHRSHSPHQNNLRLLHAHQHRLKFQLPNLQRPQLPSQAPMPEHHHRLDPAPRQREVQAHAHRHGNGYMHSAVPATRLCGVDDDQEGLLYGHYYHQ